jgi:hypothetical protein
LRLCTRNFSLLDKYLHRTCNLSGLIASQLIKHVFSSRPRMWKLRNYLRWELKIWKALQHNSNNNSKSISKVFLINCFAVIEMQFKIIFLSLEFLSRVIKAIRNGKAIEQYIFVTLLITLRTEWENSDCLLSGVVWNFYFSFFAAAASQMPRRKLKNWLHFLNWVHFCREEDEKRKWWQGMKASLIVNFQV